MQLRPAIPAQPFAEPRVDPRQPRRTARDARSCAILRTMPRALPVAGRPEDVLAHIGPGADVILPLANGEPVGLLDVLERENERLSGVRVHQMHALQERPYLHGAYGDRLRHVSYFLSHATRKAYWEGGCELVPNHFSEMPRLLELSTRQPVVLAAASPPGPRGLLLARHERRLRGVADRQGAVLPRGQRADAAHLRAQPDPREPAARLLRDGPAAGRGPAGRARRARPPIAAYIVERIPDGATLQVGIGGVPNAVLEGLLGHRDLGIHTELLADGIVDLVEAGVATGVRKQLRRNKVEATFCLGTQRLYDWLHDNGAVELLPVDLVNDPRRIAREDDFISINATTEVDLYGQCASETIAGRYWSSSGGQADFARGAMYSTARAGVHRAALDHEQGPQPDPRPADRGLGRHDAQEHRRQRGHGARDRAAARARRSPSGRGALIAVAAPRPPRGPRARGARGRDAAGVIQPVDVALRDGSTVRVREVAPADVDGLRELLGGMSENSRWLRFLSSGVDLDRMAAAAATSEDGAGLVVTAGAPERIVAHAMYIKETPARAEVAFEVADAWHGRGIATILLAHLAGAAARDGVSTFVAYVHPSNRRMVGVFRESGFPVEVHASMGELEVEMPAAIGEGARARFEDRGRAAAAAAVAHVLAPSSVLLVTVGGTAAGATVMRNLRLAGYGGELHVRVTPAEGEGALPPAELAVLAVPPEDVLDQARACGAAGVRALVVLSGGFLDGGEEGASRLQALLAICRRNGMRLVGPSSLGVLNTGVRLNAISAPVAPVHGPVAMASQSGAIGIAAISEATRRGVGLSSFASTGDKADLSGNDFLQYWERDEATRVVLLYLESFGNPRRFGAIARRVAAAKPIVAVKSGRSAAEPAPEGATATRALLGASDVSVDALFEHAGVIRTDTVFEQLDVTALLASQPLPAGGRVGIVSNGRGPAISCADALTAAGLAPQPPVDLGAEAGAGDYGRGDRARRRGGRRARRRARARRGPPAGRSPRRCTRRRCRARRCWAPSWRSARPSWPGSRAAAPCRCTAARSRRPARSAASPATRAGAGASPTSARRSAARTPTRPPP